MGEGIFKPQVEFSTLKFSVPVRFIGDVDHFIEEARPPPGPPVLGPPGAPRGLSGEHCPFVFGGLEEFLQLLALAQDRVLRSSIDEHLEGLAPLSWNESCFEAQ